MRKTQRTKKEPVRYSPEIADYVCEQMASGRSLIEVCRDEGMPTESAVRQWVLDDVEGFAAKYTRARILLAERWADEVVMLSDMDPPMTDKGSLDSAAVNHQRLRVDSRKWLLSKVLPKVYGDKLDVKHEGQVGLAININLGDQP